MAFRLAFSVKKCEDAVPQTPWGGQESEVHEPTLFLLHCRQFHIKLTKQEYKEILRGREVALELERKRLDEEAAKNAQKPADGGGDTTMGGP